MRTPPMVARTVPPSPKQVSWRRASPPSIRLPEPHGRSAAVLGDEFDDGRFEGQFGARGHKYRWAKISTKSKARLIAIPTRITVCAFGRFEGGFCGGVASHISLPGLLSRKGDFWVLLPS